MNADSALRWPPTLRPSQPTWTASHQVIGEMIVIWWKITWLPYSNNKKFFNAHSLIFLRVMSTFYHAKPCIEYLFFISWHSWAVSKWLVDWADSWMGDYSQPLIWGVICGNFPHEPTLYFKLFTNEEWRSETMGRGPVVLLLHSGLPSQTIAWTVSSDLLVKKKFFLIFFVSMPCARLC